jgi:hypothetical protein
MSTGLPVSAPRTAVRAAIDGALAVGLAVAVGTAIAYALSHLELTDTALWPLGGWLAGVGLLGTWQQVVSSDVAGGIGWTTYASGVPLLVTGVAWLFIGWRARHSPVWAVLPASVGTAAASVLLVAGSAGRDTVSNTAGSVTTTESLTWVWADNRPGTLTGAVLLVAVVWLLNTVGLRWWRSGRGVALSLLVGLGLVLTGAAAYGAVYLTSSNAVGVALALLYPLLGSLVLLGASGSPVHAGLTRLTPDPVTVSTWEQSWLYGVGGLLAVVALSLLVGLVMRLVKHRSTWLGAVSVTGVLAAFLAWATSSSVVLPEALGRVSTIGVDPPQAAAAGAVLGAVVRLAAGRSKTESVAPGPADSDIEALLNEVGGTAPT